MAKLKTPRILEDFITNNEIKTWEQLGQAIVFMSEEQKKSNITIELEFEDECLPAVLRICGENHSMLDEGHPVIFTKEA